MDHPLFVIPGPLAVFGIWCSNLIDFFMCWQSSSNSTLAFACSFCYFEKVRGPQPTLPLSPDVTHYMYRHPKNKFTCPCNKWQASYLYWKVHFCTSVSFQDNVFLCNYNKN